MQPDLADVTGDVGRTQGDGRRLHDRVGYQPQRADFDVTGKGGGQIGGNDIVSRIDVIGIGNIGRHIGVIDIVGARYEGRRIGWRVNRDSLISNLERWHEGGGGAVERGPAQKVLAAEILANLGESCRQSRQVGRLIVAALSLGSDGLERGGVNLIAEPDAINLHVGVAGGIDDVLESARAGRIVAIGTEDDNMLLITIVCSQGLNRREQGIPTTRAGGKTLNVVGPDAGNLIVQQRFVRGERLHLLRGLVFAMEFIDAELGGGWLQVDNRLGGAHLGVHRVGDAVVIRVAIGQRSNAPAEVQHQIGFEHFCGDALADALEDDRRF